MTSMNINVVDTGTLKSEAIALTTADVTIGTRTEWIQSSRALESSIGQSTARRY